MTYHGDPKWTYSNAIDRARYINDRKIERRTRGVKFVKRIYDQDAYEAGAEFNRQHGLEVQKNRDMPWLRMYRNRNVKPITLAGPDLRIKKPKPGAERLAVEKRMARRIHNAVAILEFGITELIECNDITPTGNQIARPCDGIGRLVELTQQLARAGKIEPPRFNFERKPGQGRSNKICANCGEEYLEWTCEFCAEKTRARNEKVIEESEQRRSRELANKWMMNDIKKAAKLLNEAEKKNRIGYGKMGVKSDGQS